jgi:hypothetical protein
LLLEIPWIKIYFTFVYRSSQYYRGAFKVY